MLPPRLVYYLQSLITRKLLESPTFHKLVAKTDGAFNSIAHGIMDGWREGADELAARQHLVKSDPNDHQPSTGQRRSPPDSRFTAQQSSSTYGRPHQTVSESERQRTETAEQLKELLERLRQKDKKT